MLKFNPNKTNCTGCSACYSICPVHCISMNPDEEGFKYPTASSACTNCKLCEKVCPLNNDKRELTHKQTAYAAVSKDYKVWQRSASGGAFSEIVRHWSDEETLIVGAVWDNLAVHHVAVIGYENIAPLCKSKYVASSIEDTFIEIRKHLRNGKKAIFCGCPCQVDGLRHFLIKDYENLLTIDLICHGQASPLVFKECMKAIGEQLGEEVVSYEFRTKRRVYEEDYLSKITTKKSTYYTSHDTYQKLFFSQDILRPSCGFNCKYRDAKRPGHITIADCRGLTKIFPDLVGHKRNYSTIVSNSEKGDEVVSQLSKTMKIRKYEIEDVIKYNPLFAHQTWASENRDRFFQQFIENPSATIKARTTELKIKKIGIKQLIMSYLPTWFIKKYSNIKSKL